ncbi:Bifunctional alpha/beta hydrolase/OsmC family protein, variant 2 [Balamuthia mandrillaris]
MALRQGLMRGGLAGRWTSSSLGLTSSRLQVSSRGFSWTTRVAAPSTVVVSGKGHNVQTIVHCGEKKHHHLVLDEPKAMGGEDTGPTPLEALLSALAACETATARAYCPPLKTMQYCLLLAVLVANCFRNNTDLLAKRMKMRLGDMAYHIEGFYDWSAFSKGTDTPTHFYKIVQHISVEMDGSMEKDQVVEFQRKVERLCPVSSLIHAAGVEVHTHWKTEALSTTPVESNHDRHKDHGPSE